MPSPRIYIQGNIGTDITYRKVGNSAVARFRVITNDRKFVGATSEQPNKKEYEDANTTGWNIEIWGYHADKVNKHLEKGDPVVIEGSIFEDRWTDSEGNEKFTLLVKAEYVGLNVGKVNA